MADFISKAELARKYDVSLTTVGNWLRRGCPNQRRGERTEFDLAAVRHWRAASLARQTTVNSSGRRVLAEARELLDDLVLTRDELVPWAEPVDPAAVVTFPAFGELLSSRPPLVARLREALPLAEDTAHLAPSTQSDRSGVLRDDGPIVGPLGGAKLDEITAHGGVARFSTA